MCCQVGQCFVMSLGVEEGGVSVTDVKAVYLSQSARRTDVSESFKR